MLSPERRCDALENHRRFVLRSGERREFFIQLGRRYDCRIVVRAALIFAISSGVAGFTSGW